MSADTASAPATQASGSSFYAGMRVLPKAEREAMYAIYGFCRAVDDIADDQGGAREDRAVALDGWRRDLDSLYAGNDPGQAALVADAVCRFDLDRADFEAVIDGMAMDVARDIRWPAMAELDLYCDRVASAVGRLSVRVFGMPREPGLELAHHLGRARTISVARSSSPISCATSMRMPRSAASISRRKRWVPQASRRPRRPRWLPIRASTRRCARWWRAPTTIIAPPTRFSPRGPPGI